jgi:hypothetical protein
MVTTELARPHNGSGDGDRSLSLAMPVLSMQHAVERRNAMVEFVQTIMRPNVDFGVVPGTDKPTLLKPGAEKLSTFFGLTTRFQIVERVEDWDGGQHGGEALFYYLYRCLLFRGDNLIAEADGSCNTRESKYRWRWVKESDIPPGMDKNKMHRRASSAREPDFAIRKRETGGKYGKPAAYWDRFEQAIKDGIARRIQMEKKGGEKMQGWEIADTAYRVPNDDIASQVNTIQKMAQKRALVGAVLLAVNASEFFTQDVEDMDMIDAPVARHPQVQDAEFVPVDPFVEEFRDAIASRGFAEDKADWLLASLLEKRKKTIEQVDAESRGKLLEMARGGHYDAWLRPKPQQHDSAEGGEPRAGNPEPRPGEPTVPAGTAPAPADATSAVDVSGADAEPPADAPAEPDDAKSAFEKWLIGAGELAQERNIPAADFKRRMGQVYVRAGVKGKEWTLPPKARGEVIACIDKREGYFA